MKMKIILISMFVIFIFGFNLSLAQDDTTNVMVKADTIKTYIKLKSDNPNPGGIFIAPIIGLEFPVAEFSSKSKSNASFGLRLEYSTIKTFPIIIFLSYIYQSHNGADQFVSTNYLNTFQTKIHNLGAGITIMLNKYLKSDFTLPFFDLEAKYLLVNRIVSPENFVSDIVREEKVFGLSAGLGFSLYIFDISTTYTYAKIYSTFSIRTKVRFPLIKF